MAWTESTSTLLAETPGVFSGLSDRVGERSSSKPEGFHHSHPYFRENGFI